MRKVEDVLRGSSPMNILSTLLPNPKIASLPILREYNGFRMAKDCIEGMDELIKPCIESHLKTFDPNDPRDFMDIYIAAIKDCKDQEVKNTFATAT